MTFIDYSLDGLRHAKVRHGPIPVLHHAGGDWYVSSMERLWYFIGHYMIRGIR